MNRTWKNLTLRMLGALPSARACHGMTLQSGKLFVHGGADMYGKSITGCNQCNSKISRVSHNLNTLLII